MVNRALAKQINPIIDVQQLHLTLANRVLFNGLSFTIPSGTITAILGANGRGKTTLLKLLLGFKRCQSGHITVNAPIAYVPQQIDVAFPYDVLTMVMLGRIRHLKWYSSPKKNDREIALRCLSYFDLQHLSDKPFHLLSGGEKQMVTIARALASDPQILILDEPCSALDLYNQNKVLTAIKQLTLHQDITVLFTTHQPQHALHIADYALLLQKTHEYQFGKANEVLTDEQLSQLYQMPVKVMDIKSNQYNITTAIPLFN